MAFVIADRVKETTTTTGTGAVTLAGASTGFKTFASRCAVGDTLYYAIQGIDGLGAPSGEWECGLGTYSSAGVLTRTTVTSSSNSDAAVSLSAGTKEVYITMPAVQVMWLRERLTANRTYYVRTDGSDSNTGLANTAGGAFLTIQKAIDVIRSTLDVATGVVVTVQIADGTYTGAVSVGAIVGGGTVVIQGNAGTPGNVVISTTSNTCFYFSGAGAYTFTLKDLRLQTTTSGYGVIAGEWTGLYLRNLVFGACASGHIAIITQSLVQVTGNYAVAGGGAVHWLLLSGGRLICTGRTIAITGSPTITHWLSMSSLATAFLTSNTYSGAVTGGTKYTVTQGALSEGGGTLPGSTGGSVATNGQYL